MMADMEILRLRAFRRGRKQQSVRRLQRVFVLRMRKCSYFSFSLAVAVNALRVQATVNDKMHPHRIYCLIVATILIILRTWNVIPLYNMRLVVVIDALIHYVRW